MRDPKRIQKFCNRLSHAWSAVPDMRFGQLMTSILVITEAQGRDPFYLEEDDMIKQIEELCQKFAGGHSNV